MATTSAKATPYPATLGNMKKLNELSRIKMNELIRTVAMMLGQRAGLSIHIEGSKIAHEIILGEYYTKMDLSGLASNNESLDLRMRINQKKLKELKAWGKTNGSSEVAIFQREDTGDYALMNGTRVARVDRSVAMLSAGPFDQTSQNCGVEVEVEFERISNYVAPGKPVRFDLFRNNQGLQLERIGVTGQEPLILGKNIKAFYGKKPNKTLRASHFPSFTTSDKVKFQVVTVGGDYWLQSEWQLNISSKMNAFTLNRLY